MQAGGKTGAKQEWEAGGHKPARHTHPQRGNIVESVLARDGLVLVAPLHHAVCGVQPLHHRRIAAQGAAVRTVTSAVTLANRSVSTPPLHGKAWTACSPEGQQAHDEQGQVDVAAALGVQQHQHLGTQDANNEGGAHIGTVPWQSVGR